MSLRTNELSSFIDGSFFVFFEFSLYFVKKFQKCSLKLISKIQVPMDILNTLKSKKTLKKIDESKSYKTWVSGSVIQIRFDLCSKNILKIFKCENFYSQILENGWLRTKKFTNFKFTFRWNMKKRTEFSNSFFNFSYWRSIW